MRQCGDCQLCCKLLPVDEGIVVNGKDMPGGFHKKAGERCPHQKHGKGCTIYSRRPQSCQLWRCMWLVGEDTADFKRPDRSHYVVDQILDFIRVTNDEGETELSVVQVWVDPDYPDAWRDPALMAYLERRGSENVAALVRYDHQRAIVVFAPTISTDGQWHTIDSRNNPSMVADRRHFFERLAESKLQAKIAGGA